MGTAAHAPEPPPEPSVFPWTALGDQSRYIEGRFDRLEDRIDDVHEDTSKNTVEVAVLKAMFGEVVDAFHSLKNALWGVAFLILLAAIAVIVFGHPAT